MSYKAYLFIVTQCKNVFAPSRNMKTGSFKQFIDHIFKRMPTYNFTADKNYFSMPASSFSGSWGSWC